jgi:hypothetical protein
MPRRAHDALFLTDGEVATRLGLSGAEWASVAAALAGKGLPAPDPVFNNRRYWPAVRAYLDRRAGLRQDAPPSAADGGENWNGPSERRSSRARSPAP